MSVEILFIAKQKYYKLNADSFNFLITKDITPSRALELLKVNLDTLNFMLNEKFKILKLASTNLNADFIIPEIIFLRLSEYNKITLIFSHFYINTNSNGEKIMNIEFSI